MSSGIAQLINGSLFDHIISFHRIFIDCIEGFIEKKHFGSHTHIEWQSFLFQHTNKINK